MRKKHRILSLILSASLIASTCISSLSMTVSAVQDPPATVINVTDFGADPSGKQDSAIAVQEAIEAAKEETGPVTINFPQGEYHIYPDKAPIRELYISNTVGVDQNYKMKTIGILLEEMENVTVEGNDSLIMFHGKMTTFATIDCTNVKFQNFGFDFQVPTVVDMTVEQLGNENGKDYATYYIPECYNYQIDGTSIRWMSDISPYTGQRYWTGTNSFNYTQINDLTTGETWRGGNQIFSNVSQIVDMGSNRVKIVYNSRSEDLKPGLCYQMRSTTRDHSGTFFWQSKDIELKNIDAHFMHGFGMVGQFSENITLDNVNFEVPENSGRTTAGYADFVQMSGCKGKITIKNSNFANAHDDPINIHGTFLQVTERIAPNKLKVQYKHNETGGFPNFYVGDQVEFMTRGNMVPVENSVATVTAVEGPNPGSLNDIIITLDKDLPAEIGRDTHVVENITYTPSVEITNNVFASIPTRGILVTTRKPILIENNYFDSMNMSGIYISNDAQGWYESGPVKDVVIRNNVFDKCASPVIWFDPTNSNVNADKPVHSNVLIENNLFNMENGQVLNAKSVSNLKFLNNTINRYDPNVNIAVSAASTDLKVGESSPVTINSSGTSLTSNLFNFNGCNNVLLDGNKYDGGLRMNAGSSNMPASYITIGADEGIALNGSANQTSPVGKVQLVSENPDVVQISSDGAVTAVGAGTATIYAYSVLNGRKFESSNKITFTVTNDQVGIMPQSISISSDTDKLTQANQTMAFSSTVLPAEAVQTVSWSVKDAKTSGDTTKASIDENGILTALSDGVVQVTATTANGKSASKIITISTPDSGNVLGGSWTTIRPLSDRWNFVDGADSITIRANSGSLWAGGNNANNVMVSSFDGSKENVTATLKVSGNTKAGWDESGLIFYKDDDNYVAVERKHANGSPKFHVVTESSASANEDGGISNISADDIYYKLVKAGNNITGYYSTNKENWTEIRGVNNATLGDNFKIGIIASGGSVTNTPFTFSELVVNDQPISFKSTNHPPSATALTYSTETANPNEKISVSYQFVDTDGHTEGNSVVRWAVADTQDDTYAVLPEIEGKSITVPTTLANKYLKAIVVPMDAYGKPGDIIYASTPVKIGAEITGEDPKDLPSAISNLQTAQITGVTFPEFIKGKNYYITTAPATTETVDLSFTAIDPQASIDMVVNNQPFDTATGSINQNAVKLISGHNIIELTATAPNGINKTYYRFVIMRTGYNNANLSDLKVNGQSLSGFDPAKTDYTLILNKAGNISVDAIAQSASTSMAITANATRIQGTQASVAVVPGINKIVVTMKPDTLGVNKYYTITVKVPKLDNSNLESMNFTTGVKVDQVFSPENTFYTGNATSANTTLNLVAQEIDARIELVVNGKKTVSTDNTLSQDISFYNGQNMIKATVIAPNQDKKVYTIAINASSVVYASDINWSSASTGWGTIQKDKSIGGLNLTLKDGSGNTLAFDKGIGTHASSIITYDVGSAGYDKFETYMGVDASQGGKGEVTFRIYTDDILVFDSGALTSSSPAKFKSVDLTGVKVLKLEADKGAVDYNDHADWADAKFVTSLPEAPTVDKTDLLNLISSADQYKQEDYTSESWTIFSEALTTATEIAEKEDATQQEVDDAFDNLDVAITQLTQKEYTVEDIANALVIDTPPAVGDTQITMPTVPEGFAVAITASSDENVITLDGTIIPPAVKTSVELTFTVSKTTRSGETATKVLTVVVPAKEKPPIEGAANKTILNFVINYADSKMNEVETLVPSAKIKFMAAYNNAVTVQNTSDATQEQVDQAWVLLMDAIHMLSFQAGDKTELNMLIQMCDLYDINDIDGDTTAFTSALAAAKAVSADPDAMDNDIKTVYDALNEAVKALVFKDRTQLEAVVAYADGRMQIIDLFQDGQAKTTFIAALAAAKAVLTDKTSTQAQIDATTQALTEATANLRFIADKATLEKVLNDAKSIDVSVYTAVSVSALEDAIKAGQKVFDDPNATKEQIDAAEEKINTAKTGLIVKDTTPETTPVDKTEATADGANGTTRSATTGESNAVAIATALLLLSGATLLFKKRINFF